MGFQPHNTLSPFPSPPSLFPSFTTTASLHFPSLPPPAFPTASVFAAYTQNATANFQLRHEKELTSLLRSRSLAFALSLPLPLSAAYETSSASAALNVKCLDCVSACLCVCVFVVGNSGKERQRQRSSDVNSDATSPSLPPPPHCSLYNEVCCFEA